MIIYTTKPNTSFLINEIKTFGRLSKELVVLYEIDNPVEESVAEKATFKLLKKQFNSVAPFFILKNLKSFLQVLSTFGLREFINGSLSGNFSDQVIRMQNAVARYNQLTPMDVDLLHRQKIALSFWFFDLSFLLLLKKKNIISKVYSRAHRADLIIDNEHVHYLFGRISFLKGADGLFPISNFGRDYLLETHPAYSGKIERYYLGSTRLYFPFPAQEYQQDFITIVTCAWIRNVKRLHLIPEILTQLGRPFQWVHFGAGDVESENLLNAAIAKEGIEDYVSLMGTVSNDLVQKYLSENWVDCVLSVSSIEGIPVTFMEAISYGIPVVATDVGGNNEIVNETTGFLIDLNGKPKEFAEAIKKTTELDRNKIEQFWKEKFDAHTLSSKLFSRISC